MNLNIEKTLYENVVSLICDDRRGTAFFISEDILLTARHNIIGHLEDKNIPIVVMVDGVSLMCTGESLGNPGETIDVAILKLSTKHNRQSKGLKVLAAKLSREIELYLLGYPNELGGCVDPIFLPLRYFGSGHHSDADLILLKNSEVSFFSYAGFSGSPVVNSSGSVVGITIIEESHNLRAISVVKIREALGLKNIRYSTNDLIEDDSPIGLLRCKLFLDNAIKKAGRKYSPELHVPQSELEEEFASFMNFGIIDECEILKSDIENWCTNFPQFGEVKIIDGKGAKKNHIEYIEEISYTLWPHRNDLDKQSLAELEHIRNIYFLFKEKLKRRYQSERKLFSLHGSAGTGKSHICHSLAETYLSKEHHVYICHGTDIASESLPEKNLMRIFGFDSDMFNQINERAIESQKYVLFVIDALNEGAGFKYWEDNLFRLLDFAKQYSMFKFLVSERRYSNSLAEALREKGYHSVIYTHQLDGFEDVDQAIVNYAKANKITPETLYKYNVDFSNPLMLSLFCRSIGKRINISGSDKDLTRQDVYADYLSQRNIVISDKVDVDPHMNVTLAAVYNICRYTVFNSKDLTILRNVAMKICNKIAYRPYWSTNLLHHLIDENILYEFNSWDEYNVQSLDFEFQNIGDVFRAHALLSSKWTDDKILMFLYDRFNSPNYQYQNDNIVNFIAAVIGMWNRNTLPLGFINSVPIEILEDALAYKGISRDTIENFWKTKFSDIPITLLFRNIHNFSNRFILNFHNYLLSLRMDVRDLAYIRFFNRQFEIHGTNLDFGTVTNDINNESQYLFKLAWMATSSHPDFRAMITRHMTRILCIHPSLAKHLVRLFIEVDDVYVLSAILCAVYGCLLITRNTFVAQMVSKIIYNKLYSKAEFIPLNLHVRQWSLLILEFSYILDSSIDYFLRISLPLSHSQNYLDLDYSDINTDTIFGKTKGGEMLQYNLFQSSTLSSDFNRYIIGTNHHTHHPNFFISEEKDLSLSEIEKMIAKEIIKLGWNDSLGEIDTLGYSPTRHENSKERIGKKYLWIAYQNVMANLSDYCYFIENQWSYNRKYIKAIWPWLVDGRSLFDPTLNVKPFPESETPKFQFIFINDDISQYLSTTDSYPYAELRQEDESGSQWLLVDGWDGKSTHDAYGYSNVHIEYLSWVIKGLSLDELYKIIRDNPDIVLPDSVRNQYEFFWNEFPWSKRCKVNEYHWNKFLTGEIMPLCVSQLQENFRGIEYEKRPMSNATLLNWEICETLNLMTAERGILRDKEGTVVAYSRVGTELGCDGLVVRTETLKQYLAQVNGFCLLRIEYYKSNHHSSHRTYKWAVFTSQGTLSELPI